MSLILGMVTMVFQKENAIRDIIVRDDNFASRLATAGCAVWFYLYKLVIPVNLIFNYPRWNIAAWGVTGFLPLAALAAGFCRAAPMAKDPSAPAAGGFGHLCHHAAADTRLH